MESFLEYASESFKDEKAFENLIAIYGSKEKVVETSLKAQETGRAIKNKEALDRTIRLHTQCNTQMMSWQWKLSRYWEKTIEVFLRWTMQTPYY